MPTAEQGDCGIDVMAFWDGKDRAPATWKAIRIEIASLLDESADSSTWQTTFGLLAEQHANRLFESWRPAAIEAELARADVDAGQSMAAAGGMSTRSRVEAVVYVYSAAWQMDVR